MRLRSFALQPIGGGTARPLHNARSRWSSRCGLLVTLQGEDGHSGIGEASPLPGYSPDDLPVVAASLETFLASLSSVPETPEGIEERCAALGSPAARFAAETALLDLLARARGCPLHELFRPAAGAIERSGLLQSSTPEGLLQEAREKRSQGLSCLKIKIGALPIEEEIARLRALHEGVLGSRVTLRLDANGALSLDRMLRLVEGLQGLFVDVIEEPVPPEDWSSLVEPPGLAGARWGADETLQHHAEALLEHRACEVFVLKPALLGFFGALRLAERALARGKRVLVTHLFDGPVALAAACELALALPPDGLLPCGLDPHDGLAAFPAVDVPQLRQPGLVSPTSWPGLALDLDLG